jgi:hypothetical protein
VPRFQSCSFFPYTLNENGEVVLLLRNKKDSKNPDFYTEFGTTVKENEPNIFYSAARSFLTKTASLFVASELESLNSATEVEKKLKESSHKNEIDLFKNPKMKEVLSTMVSN